MTLRRIFRSRFVVVPVALAVFILIWNIYVSLHAHGLVVGRIVDRAGHPIAGATVILFTHDFVTQVEKARTETNVSGTFSFTKNDSHLVQLQALDGPESSPRLTIRLWFRAQDRVLGVPLVVAPQG